MFIIQQSELDFTVTFLKLVKSHLFVQFILVYSASKGFTEYQQHNENVWRLAGVLKKKTTNLCARMNKLCTQINNLYGSLGFNAVLFGFWMDMHGNTSHFAHLTSIKYVKCQYGE